MGCQEEAAYTYYAHCPRLVTLSNTEYFLSVQDTLIRGVS